MIESSLIEKSPFNTSDGFKTKLKKKNSSQINHHCSLFCLRSLFQSFFYVCLCIWIHHSSRFEFSLSLPMALQQQYLRKRPIQNGANIPKLKQLNSQPRTALWLSAQWAIRTCLSSTTNNWLISVSRQKHQEDYATLYKVNEKWPGHAVLIPPALVFFLSLNDYVS